MERRVSFSNIKAIFLARKTRHNINSHALILRLQGHYIKSNFLSKAK